MVDHFLRRIAAPVIAAGVLAGVAAGPASAAGASAGSSGATTPHKVESAYTPNCYWELDAFWWNNGPSGSAWYVRGTVKLQGDGQCFMVLYRSTGYGNKETISNQYVADAAHPFQTTGWHWDGADSSGSVEASAQGMDLYTDLLGWTPWW